MAFLYKGAFTRIENDPDLVMETKKLVQILIDLKMDVFEVESDHAPVNVNDSAFILNGIALICSQNALNSQRAVSFLDLFQY
ncbi:hypothetical protein Ciccas_012657 [Cichlidogyrus casuarinus]|uniref:Uncharacterized protein n=1 Tax=Cichlidogyrus casuarinus TaxID=1844966 RepID=A0ABD2PP51_9PLAT